MAPILLTLFVLTQSTFDTQPALDAGDYAANTTRFRGALELSGGVLPSGPPGGQLDGFGFIVPMLAFDGGPDFGLELGAELRLRALDNLPSQRATDFRGFLRREDWDEASDFGQLLRELHIGKEEDNFFLQAGAIHELTLGHGHLVSRYNNRLNPDYHPAGVSLHLEGFSPVRMDVLVSDLLAPRIFAGELQMDIGRVASPSAEFHDRYHASLSAAHDTGRTGAGTQPVTLLQVDADAVLHQDEQVRVLALAGLGGRVLDTGLDLSAALGFVASGWLNNIELGGKLEGRRPGRQFPVGMLGPTYELSRFSAIGFGRAGLTQAVLPDGFSGYLELHAGWGSALHLAPDKDAPWVRLSAAAEYFTWGRLDADARLTVRLPNQEGTVSARFAVVGLMELPRYDGGFEVRYRVLPSFYVLGTGGTVFFPQPDSSLSRGLYAGLGVGLDFER